MFAQGSRAAGALVLPRIGAHDDELADVNYGRIQRHAYVCVVGASRRRFIRSISKSDKALRPHYAKALLRLKKPFLYYEHADETQFV